MRSRIRTRRPRAALVVVTALAIGNAACQRGSAPATEEEPPGAAETHAGEEAHEERVVRLDPDTRKEFGIEVATAARGSIERSITLPGEVRPNEDRLAHIAPRFPGIAREVHAQIGDAVNAGQVLAVIESESLAPYPLKTLIDGVVIAKHITRGEPVSREQAAFVVADLREVWVNISVYQRDMPLLRVGQPVVVSAGVSAGHERGEARGRISYIAPVVDEETRTATARVVLPNPEGIWRPGLFVTARVEVERAEVPIAVLDTALQAIEGETVVFVETADSFSPRPVVLGEAGDGLVEIRSGLGAGERYVSSGGLTLKAELAREELGGGHGH